MKKAKERFHECLKARLNDNRYHIGEIGLTEKLCNQGGALYIPFGWASYFLTVENGRPLVCVKTHARG